MIWIFLLIIAFLCGIFAGNVLMPPRYVAAAAAAAIPKSEAFFIKLKSFFPKLKPFFNRLKLFFAKLQLLFINHIWRKPDVLLFLSCMTAAVCIALRHGQDAFWDITNYHIYLPYALFNGRLGADIVPAGMHSYFNPAADIPLYILIKYLNSWPRIAASIQSVWLALAFFFTFKITGLFLDKRERVLGGILACVILAGSVAVSISGTSATGDMMTTPFILAALYITLKYAGRREGEFKFSLFAAAGFLLGCGLAFKYTNAPFIIGFAFVLLFSFGSFKESIKCWISFSAGFILAFALIAGPWLYKMYANFESPLFPFYNNIFHSPYFENVALIDPRFLKNRSFWDLFLIPFYAIYFRNMVVLESGIRTLTFFSYWAAFITITVLYFKGKLKKILPDGHQRKALILLTAFVIISYIFWFKMFSIVRYIMPMEAAGAVIITFVLFSLAGGKYKYFIISAAACSIAFYTMGPPYYTDFGPKIVNVKTFNTPYARNISYFYRIAGQTQDQTFPRVEDGSAVILAGWRLSYIIPFMNPNASYVGGIPADIKDYEDVENKLTILRETSFPDVFYKHKLKEAVLEKIKNSENVYVLLSSYAPTDFFTDALYHYGVKLNLKKCQLIVPNLTLPIWLCRAEKI
ncbi:MAG: glycosyltransferase family 39 protein [Elusimicrobia bacterium]|nr:glycosyltransferase family 39 protein [Elusimicrobiota bacterium]